MENVAKEYTGRTEEYAAHTHSHIINADSMKYDGRTIVTLGVTGPGAKP